MDQNSKKTARSIEEQLNKISEDIGGGKSSEQESLDRQLQQVMQKIDRDAGKKAAGREPRKDEKSDRFRQTDKGSTGKTAPQKQDIGRTKVIGDLKTASSKEIAATKPQERPGEKKEAKETSAKEAAKQPAKPMPAREDAAAKQSAKTASAREEAAAKQPAKTTPAKEEAAAKQPAKAAPAKEDTAAKQSAKAAPAKEDAAAKQAVKQSKKKPAEEKRREKALELEEDLEETGSGKAKRIVAIAACVLALLLVVGYCVGIFYYNSHFYRNTSINDIDFSNKNVSQVEETLTKEVRDYVLTLQERENMTEKISGKDIDLELVFDSNFQDLQKSQNPFAWIVGLFKKSEYSVGSSLKYNKDKLELAKSSLKASNKVLMIAPVDATVEWNETDGYFINPGVAGTQINEESFTDAVEDAVKNLESTLNLEEKNCYVAQNITGDDKRLIDAAAELNKCSQAVINYHFGDTTETCSGEVIRSWLSLGEDYSVQVSAEKAREYIDTLGDKYNTYQTTRNFTTHGGGTVEITQGDYGWRMNRADMTDELVAAVRQGGAQDKEPMWLQTANSMSGPDWGNTYVEISLSAQHLWFYKDGSVIVESDIVSGKMADGRATPSGIYSLKYKEKDRTLRGQIQANGQPEYESFVNFWMPFNGGVGMHDASWRSSFGGSIYVNSGSHGCINLPYSKAKAIYENIASGTPIICYYGSSAAARVTEAENDVSEVVPASVPSSSEESYWEEEEDSQSPQDTSNQPQPTAETVSTPEPEQPEQQPEPTPEAESGDSEENQTEETPEQE